MPTVELPSLLSRLVDGKSVLVIEGSTVGEVFNNLVRQYPELSKYLLDSSGQVPVFLSVYVNEKDIRELGRQATIVQSSDIITLVPALSGG